MRLVALGALLLAVYAATLTIPAGGRDDYAGDEVHYLLGARSWVEDGDLDLANQYSGRQWREFATRAPQPSGTLVLDNCARLRSRMSSVALVRSIASRRSDTATMSV